MRDLVLETGVAAAKAAGKLLMGSYGRLTASQIACKSKNDFVTELDKASEKLVVSAIRKKFPEDAILAEEGGRTPGRGRVWIIDPLDGTSNYIHRIPMFAVSIGVVENGKLRAGVVYDPVNGELFTASAGRGAYLNGRRLRVTKIPKLAQAFMATGIPFRAHERFSEYLSTFETISLGSAGMRRCGSAALDLAYVAAGRFDGFWELDLSPWDIAAGAILVEEAGGKATDLWGGPTLLQTGDTLATNGLIHGELKKILTAAVTPQKKDKLCLSA